MKVTSTVYVKEFVNTDLVLDARILSFRVFTNKDGIDIIIWRLVSGNGNAWTNVGEKVESPSEGQVEGNVTLSNCLGTFSAYTCRTMDGTHSV